LTEATLNVLDFGRKKKEKEKITVITCYDHWSARIINESTVDCILVGDSLAMVMHGHPSTLAASIDLMALHISAVARGAPDKFIVGDMPFMSYRKDLASNMTAVETLMKAGAHAVKLEGVQGNEEFIRHVVDSGVPVMGHIGLTPQSVHQMGGYKVQGRDENGKAVLMQQALALQNAGCFSLVLECIPGDLAVSITSKLQIPTIGIGAGSQTDGQVLVLHDMLGLSLGKQPKFVRKFLNGAEAIQGALGQYVDDVKAGKYPTEEESY
jgi:3-methyl-2-oxobutanoate hydroxymethyltransferase